ncbi:MAG: S46 family peptidase [Marinilabiliales bacterium]|nr:S46 family peptidase [Marinilabiliales bacterium]
MADPKVNIQYASKYSGSSNYWKFSIGQNEGLEPPAHRRQESRL